MQVRERAVLRAAARAAAELPRARQRRHASTTSSASPKTCCGPIACRSSSSATRRRFALAAARRRLRHVRDGGARRPRSDAGELQAEADQGGAAGGAGGAGRAGRAGARVGWGRGRAASRAKALAERRGCVPAFRPAISRRRWRAGRRRIDARGGAKADGAARSRDRGQGRPRQAARPQDDRRQADADEPSGRTASRQVETTNYIRVSRIASASRRAERCVAGVRRHAGRGCRIARGVRDAAEADRARSAASLRRDVVALLLAAKDGTLTPRILPDVKDRGRTHRATRSSSPAADLNPIVLYVDPDSGLIRKRMYTADAPGRPVVEEQFSDYRPSTASRSRSARRRRLAAVGRAPRHRRQGQHRRSTPRCSNARRLERSPSAVRAARHPAILYAGALTRELLALDPSLHDRRARRAAVRGGRRPPRRRLPRHRGHRPDRGDSRSCRGRSPRAAGWWRRREADRPDALILDRLSRLQLPAGAADQAARRAGHLLHQPADLGVAGRAARRRSARSPIACW
mgnify:CR=1 FL=1